MVSMPSYTQCFLPNPQQLTTATLLPGAVRHTLEPRRPWLQHSASQHRQRVGRRRALSVAADASDHEAPVARPIAGIPVSVDRSTAVGERLWTALQLHPHDFVSLVVIELQQVCAPTTPLGKRGRVADRGLRDGKSATKCPYAVPQLSGAHQQADAANGEGSAAG